VSCKIHDEYAHLIDGPYWAGPDRSKERLDSARPATPSSTTTPSTSTALQINGAPSSEAEAARKAREV
jgi:hypothetical protein